MRRVLILGLGHRDEDPLGEWERWCLPWGSDEDGDLYFEIHERRVWGRYAPRAYVEDMNYRGAPVLMREAHKDLPVSRKFPMEQVANVCGGAYFESSIAWMVGYAIYCDVDEIAIWGVGAPFDTEYVAQRANIEYLIGVARGRGIKVKIMPSSDLMRSMFAEGVYGVQ